jgi:hypothetical protein
MRHDDDFISEDDALAYADSIHEDVPDLIAGLGFGPATGVDVAMQHDGMLAVGLAMQEEFDHEFN